MNRARPLAGTFYRSVEYRFMDPTEVLSGIGTQRYGGRFAMAGTRAVYLAGSDEAATREVLARKKRLGNTSQITLAKYPRVVFAVTVTLQKVLTWLRKPRSMALSQIRESCLAVDDLTRSQASWQKNFGGRCARPIVPKCCWNRSKPDRLSGELPSFVAYFT